MTLANQITLFRLLLIPVFIILVMSYDGQAAWPRISALAVFAVAAISDGIDGFVARAYNQKTRLGAALDPLADKLLINLGLVFLAVNQNLATPVPQWLPVIVLSRDVLIVMGSYLLNEYFGPFRPRPRFSGKLTTTLQMSAIIAVLLEVRFAYPLLLAMVSVTVISLFDYLYAGMRQVGNEDQH